MSLFYYFLLRKNWLLWLIPFVLGSLLIQYLWLPETVKDFNPFGLSVTQSLIVIYALLYYYKSLEGDADFLFVNAGVLMYFMASILFFSTTDWIQNLELPFLIRAIFNSINDVLYFIFLTLILIEWFKNFRRKKMV
ncbi:hypothetical protein G5B37_04480 [Rasiella rasia]|uniref:Uncharacterized protein n=1 Tax=Rasiella rasia TaxID=2744027 RepID=A0A6G6GJW4_9FLAO|nr:hypothetical protein [Rasiella rasia]QIE58842.1 hypothetical protein G5B37_04480 [Rasiella rasia]